MKPKFALLGRFCVKVDEGGTLSLPLEWYEAMGRPMEVYLVSDVNERCLDLIPKEVFDEYVSSNIDDVEEAAMRERLKQEARSVKVDDRRRIDVDDDLRAFAGITDCVAMVGTVRFAKLYNLDTLQSRNELLSAKLLRMLDAFEDPK